MAITLTHKIGKNYSSDAGQMSAYTAQVTGDYEVNVRKTVPAGSTAYEIDAVIDNAKLQSIGVSASQPCTVKTNSTGSPGDTVTWAAGELKEFALNLSGDNPFPTAAVTKLYIAVPGTTDCDFRLSALLNY